MKEQTQDAGSPLVFLDPDGCPDVDVSQVSACRSHSLTECEKSCIRYTGCDTVALCSDILVEFEKLCTRYGNAKALKMF